MAMNNNRGRVFTDNLQPPKPEQSQPSMTEKLLTNMHKTELRPETSTSAKRLTDGPVNVRAYDDLRSGAEIHQGIADQYRNVNRFQADAPPAYTREHYHKAWATGLSPAELARCELLGTIPPLEAGRYVEEKTLPPAPTWDGTIKLNFEGPGLTWDQYAKESIPRSYAPPIPTNPASEIDLENGEPYVMPPAVKYRRRRVAQQEAREMLAFYGWVVSKDDGINLAQATRLKNLIAEGKVEKKNG